MGDLDLIAEQLTHHELFKCTSCIVYDKAESNRIKIYLIFLAYFPYLNAGL